ncbi:DUF7344 domain-containing protein [Halocalculus aciditolerans]|uniref:DUF7344 domain-containing protein n=1 Tax=Halocalculus aciditolerans TaxID=1383812 RepID=A0A830F6Z3_9EURY|nr:hypothetical protein [Halocalculus aciditolerans]GGL47019.1 hypothetical protein GCM10009039_01640 [Halocalculus aciditolerans]
MSGLGTLDAEESRTGLEQSDIHDVLRNDRRRMTLEILQASGGVTLRELSERIASRESGATPAPRDVRQSVYVSLQQTHIPKLESLDVVEEDTDGEIRLAERAGDLNVYMEVVPKYGLAWSEYYGSLAVLGSLLVAAASLDVVGITRLAAELWAVCIFAVILASAVYQTYTQGSSILNRIRD